MLVILFLEYYFKFFKPFKEGVGYYIIFIWAVYYFEIEFGKQF